MKYFVPDRSVRAVTDISPEDFVSLGIKLVFIDLDNTLTLTGSASVRDDIKQWLKSAKSRGLLMCIVSNETRSYRVARIASELGVQYIAPAWKPRPSLIRRLLKAHKLQPHEAAMIGDQIFTDVFMAKRIGMIAFLVEPLSPLSFITTKTMRLFERLLLKWMHRNGLLCQCSKVRR